MSPVSASVAARGAPMSDPAAVFSGKLRVAVSDANSGALFACAEVVPVPEVDQALSPTGLVARTCTW